MEPLRYWPHMFFVARYGLGDFEDAMRFQYELTKRSTAEGSIRAFIEDYPERAYERLLEWTSDPNMHVRRLVSEGTRPRLPWASRLRAFQDDPAPVIRLLEMLRDDPERYVQRSVANNLNDIAKNHPSVAVEVCKRWSINATPGRKWIVRHALRSLVKQGNRGALEVMGYASSPLLTIKDVLFTPTKVALGGKLRFSFELMSESDQDQRLLIDYAVHFVKANGKRAPKVFKLRELVLPTGGDIGLEGTISFAEMSTRKPRPGVHRIDLLVNGVSHDLGEFEVIE
jgi:3-methyladenine DNA glycosylase AlkC